MPRKRQARARSAVACAAALIAAGGCHARVLGRAASSTPASTPPAHSCNEREALFDGGSFLHTDDGVALWFKVAGRAGAPTAVYLHGGPCFGSLDFEKSVGARLEQTSRVVYFDQRGCGRSTSGTSNANLDMASTVEDLERIRVHLGIDKLDLIAHSAGGWVALEYLRKHADHVGRIVLVDTSGAFQQSLQYRLDYAAEVAPRLFPERAERIRELARRGRSAGPEVRLQAFGALFELMGADLWFRTLYYASDQERSDVERWSSELRSHCSAAPMAAWYGRSGYLMSDHDELMTPLAVPSLLVAGRQSHVFGPELLEEAAQRWRSELRWIDDAGHFPFAAQPEEFSEVVLAFIGAPLPAAPALG